MEGLGKSRASYRVTCRNMPNPGRSHDRACREAGKAKAIMRVSGSIRFSYWVVIVTVKSLPNNNAPCLFGHAYINTEGTLERIVQRDGWWLSIVEETFLFRLAHR
jgi:hypothetical protein